jgi:hypothetical protein
MSLVLVDYTIQAVWSFFNNWLTFIMDRKTRIANGEEEMLPHTGKRSVDLIICHFSLRTFNTCTTQTWMLEMTTGVIKLLRAEHSLHITISIMQILTAGFAVFYRFITHKRAMYFHFR